MRYPPLRDARYPEPAGIRGVSAGNAALLSFDAISAEITVSYEHLEELHDPSGTVAMNLE